MILLFVATPARADSDRARALFTEGSKLYNLGDYQAALDAFKRAYLEKPDPVLLFNLAQTWRRLGDKLKAVGNYRAYLRESPDAPNAEEVQKLVLRLDAEILEDRASRDAPPEGAVAPAAPADPPRPWWRNGAGWAVAGAGAGVAVAGGGLLGGSVGIESRARGASTLPEQRDLHGRAQSMEIGGWALLGVGAAITVVGVVLLATRQPKGR